MKATALCTLAVPLLCLAFAVSHAQAASDPTLESMATCQDSWLDWKVSPARGEKFAETLRAGYIAKDAGYFVPKAKASLFGLPVTRVYPESVGMGVGFSVMIAGNFESAKKAVEKAIGKPLVCEADSEEVRACEAQLGPKKNVTVASDPGDTKTALIGCFYYYEK